MEAEATVRGLGKMRPCSGAVFDDQPVERPHILRLSGVAAPLRLLLGISFSTGKPVKGLHPVSHVDGQSFNFFMTAGEVSDYIGAAALLDDLREGAVAARCPSPSSLPSPSLPPPSSGYYQLVLNPNASADPISRVDQPIHRTA